MHRSPSRSPRRSGASPQRTLIMDGPGASPITERSEKAGEGADARRFRRPQSPLRSSSRNAVAAAASPLLNEMLEAASPSISRFGSPGRFSQLRGGSPGRGRGRASSPLASVRALSASRSNARTFVEQLRSRSPGRDGAGSPIRSTSRSPRVLRLDSDDSGASDQEATSRSRASPTRPSTGVRR